MVSRTIPVTRSLSCSVVTVIRPVSAAVGAAAADSSPPPPMTAPVKPSSSAGISAVRAALSARARPAAGGTRATTGRGPQGRA
eukprot:2179326-Pyramimonas_sp.AAC.1